MRLLLSALSVASTLAGSGGLRKLSISNLNDDFTDESATLADWDGVTSNRIDSLVVSNENLVLTPSSATTFGYYGNGNGVSITKSIERVVCILGVHILNIMQQSQSCCSSMHSGI